MAGGCLVGGRQPFGTALLVLGLARSAGGDCVVSSWSSWDLCAVVESCQPCDYGASVGSWTRPTSGTERASRAYPERESSRELSRVRDEGKMARKAALWRDAPRSQGRASDDAGAECSDGDAAGFPCVGVDLVTWTAFEDLSFAGLEGSDITNDNWGWTSEEGVEWALVAHTVGVSFLEVGAAVPAGHLKGKGDSLWRDVKTYDHYALVVSENSRQGMQVFDLERLDASKRRAGPREGASTYLQREC